MSDKLNILAIHNYYQHRGGEDMVFEAETEALIQAGHTVLKYTRHNEELNKFSFLQKIMFFFRSVYNTETVNAIKEILKHNNIDIAHIHNTFPLISPSIFKILNKNNIKVVQTLHNYRFICPNGLFYDGVAVCELCKNGNTFYCIKKKCYKSSLVFSILYAIVVKLNNRVFKNMIDRYIALTEFTKNKFAECGFDNSKITIKYNFIMPKELKRGEDGGYYLYLGRISHEKGIDFLLEVFADLKEYKLIVAGGGDLLEYYKIRYADSKNIVFTGFMSGESKENLIINATAMIVPSICYETYSLSLAEAFAYGIPVIGSNFGGIPFLIKDGYNGVVIKDLEGLCMRLALDRLKSERDKLGDGAYQTYLDRMTPESNIEKLITIYKEVRASSYN